MKSEFSENSVAMARRLCASPTETLGPGYSLVFTDFLLASFISSTGADSGEIILPIARSISETYDLHPDDDTNGRLVTFLMNLLFECEVILRAAF
jgi:DASS family divalent anion:Na+ symporter